MNPKGRNFLVTGGASGLGAASARKIVAAGGKVLIADRNDREGIALAAELGPAARFALTDVTREDSAQAAIALAIQTLGPLHGLVNCAGIGGAEKILGKDGVHRLASFTQVLQVNLVGSFNMIRLAAAAMSSNEADEGGERGIIVNTASVAAFEGQIGQAAYSASKGGIVAMTLPIARELARHGIRVMTIAPGIMETPMLHSLPQEVQDSLGLMVPFPARLGKPEEFAALVVQIVENPYLNAEVIRLDGGIRMAAR